MATNRSLSFGRADAIPKQSDFCVPVAAIRHVRRNVPMMGDDIMSESRDALAVSHSRAETAPKALTFDERWARWLEKGARHDARVRRNMRLIAMIAAIALTIGGIWASVWPR